MKLPPGRGWYDELLLPRERLEKKLPIQIGARSLEINPASTAESNSRRHNVTLGSPPAVVPMSP